MSVHDRWAGARKGAGRRWEVRWRDGGAQRKRRFDTRQAAERFEAQRKLEPEVRRAQEGRALTVERMVDTWLKSCSGLAPKTVDAYRADAAEINAGFGPRLASTLLPSEIGVWSGRNRGVSLRRRSMGALSRAYKLAIADGMLKVNPCDGLPLPRRADQERRYLSWPELRRLADAAGEWAPLVLLLGTCGLRLGEAIGLRVGDVDVARGRLRVSRSVTTSSAGVQVGPVKNRKGREVPVPAAVLEVLPLDRGREEWLFVGALGGRLNPSQWRRGPFGRACREAGIDLQPHELRHTAASLAIAAGADVMAVQRMLGHASPAITLNLYSHLWDNGLDGVAARIDAVMRAS